MTQFAVPLNHNQIVLINTDLRSDAKTPHRNGDALARSNIVRIMECSSMDSEGGYAPAECVTVNGEGIEPLRDALLKAFPPEATINPLPLVKLIPQMVLTLTIGLDDKFDKDFVVAIGKDLSGAGFDVEFETLPAFNNDNSRTWVAINVRKP